MDQAISQFFTAGSVILAISVVIATFFIRRVVETAVPSVKKMADENDPHPTYKTGFARWWNKVILYLIPVLVGACIGMFDIPYLFSIEGLDGMSSRVFFGGVVGWMSSVVYKGVRMAIQKKTGVDIQPSHSVIPGGDSTPPKDEDHPDRPLIG